MLHGGKNSIIPCWMGKLLFFCSTAICWSRLRSVLMSLLFYHSKLDSVLINGYAFITCYTFVNRGICTSTGVFKCHVSSIHKQQRVRHRLSSRIPDYIQSFSTKLILGIFCTITLTHFWLYVTQLEVLVGCATIRWHECRSCIRCFV